MNEKGITIFVINHNQTAASVDFGADKLVGLNTEGTFTGTVELAGRDVLVLKVEG